MAGAAVFAANREGNLLDDSTTVACLQDSIHDQLPTEAFGGVVFARA